jgi:hypothetical protein
MSLMALLRFTDANGREWEVWEVGVRHVPDDVRVRDRDFCAGLPERWLCFASATERRRLTTYPPRWHAMSPVELEALCRAALPRKAPMPAPTTPDPGDRPDARPPNDPRA